jgi:hypothetical protein
MKTGAAAEKKIRQYTQGALASSRSLSRGNMFIRRKREEKKKSQAKVRRKGPGQR